MSSTWPAMSWWGLGAQSRWYWGMKSRVAQPAGASLQYLFPLTTHLPERWQCCLDSWAPGLLHHQAAQCRRGNPQQVPFPLQHTWEAKLLGGAACNSQQSYGKRCPPTHFPQSRKLPSSALKLSQLKTMRVTLGCRQSNSCTDTT